MRGDERYAYVNNDPVNGVDPVGLFEIPTFAFGGLDVLPFSDQGHGDIIRVAFAQYNAKYGLRFSQTIIDQIVINNYHSDTASLNGGQFNFKNHFDNPNDGPIYVDKGSGGFGVREKLPGYADGVNDDWFADSLAQINTNRGLYSTVNNTGVLWNISTILNRFGQNTHALGGFYAHSNWVDANERGGCVENRKATARSFTIEKGYVPIGLNESRIWDEEFDVISRDSLYSGTVCFLCGDISNKTDKTTHGYWNKDSQSKLGGSQKYELAETEKFTSKKMFFWEVKKFDPKQTGILGQDYFTDTGLPPKEGDRIYVATEITNRHQMAFHLAIEHTKQEIGRLYDGAVGQKVGVHNLVDVFKMDKDALGAAGIAYQQLLTKK